MSGIQCEICGGQIEMQSGGSKGICVQCGITYSADRVRELYSGKRTPVTSGGNAAYTEFDIRDGVLVKYNGCKEKVVVPYGVKIIGKSAFYQNSYVTEVVLPETVSRIDCGAFQWAESLKIINLTDKIKEIENEAFEWSGLESVTIPSISVLGSGAFLGCKNLISVVFSNGVKKIESRAFEGCKNLNMVTFPDTLEYIGESAFGDCDNITALTFPDALKTIEFAAFQRCKNLAAVTFPHMLETIGGFAFEDCNNLSGVNLNQNTKFIGAAAFKKCGIEWLKITSKDICLGREAFLWCNKLSTVMITGKITGEKGGNLRDLDLFAGCENVKEVTCEENYVEELFGRNNNIERLNGEIYVSESKKMQRRQAYTCQYCGGPFKGVFSKVCSQCGTPKDY